MFSPLRSEGRHNTDTTKEVWRRTAKCCNRSCTVLQASFSRKEGKTCCRRFSTSMESAMIWLKSGWKFVSLLTDCRIFRQRWYITSVYEKPSIVARGPRGSRHLVMMAIGDRSKDRDSKLSCHTMVHLRDISHWRRKWGLGNYQSFRLGRSLAAGIVIRAFSCGSLCNPRAWASLHVRPIKAQDASAFISFARTKPNIRSACSDSREGRIKKFDSLRQWKDVCTRLWSEFSFGFGRGLTKCLRRSHSLVIWKFSVVRCNREHSEQHTQPSRRDTFAGSCMLWGWRSIFEIDTELCLEIFNVDK